jgi:lysophospholipase L1-like esterase
MRGAAWCVPTRVVLRKEEQVPAKILSLVCMSLGVAFAAEGPQVKHVVLFKYTQGTTPEKIKELRDAFAALPSKVPGVVGFECGVNSSPEGLSQGFDHAFILTFRDAAARDAYLPHPAHREFGKLLGGVLETPLVVDFAASTPAVTVEHPDAFALVRGDRIVMAGDSITQGGGYVRAVKAVLDRCYGDLGVEVVNAGISGNKVTDLSARAGNDIIAKKPTVVTIAIGINDVWHGFDNEHPQGGGPNCVPLPKYIETYRELIVRIKRETGARVFLLTPTVIGENTNELGARNLALQPYCAAVRALAREQGAGLIELNDAFLFACHAFALAQGARKDAGNLTGDGVHMLPAGDFMMAAKILQAFGVPSQRILSITPADITGAK